MTKLTFVPRKVGKFYERVEVFLYGSPVAIIHVDDFQYEIHDKLNAGKTVIVKLVDVLDATE